MIHLMQAKIGPSRPNMRFKMDGMDREILLTFGLASRLVNFMFELGVQDQVVVHLCDGRKTCRCKPMRWGQWLDDLIK